MSPTLHLSEDALSDKLLHESVARGVGAEAEQGGHALVFLLREVVFVEQLVRGVRPDAKHE